MKPPAWPVTETRVEHWPWLSPSEQYRVRAFTGKEWSYVDGGHHTAGLAELAARTYLAGPVLITQITTTAPSPGAASAAGEEPAALSSKAR